MDIKCVGPDPWMSSSGSPQRRDIGAYIHLYGASLGQYSVADILD